MYNFYLLSFSSFSSQFWLEMNPQWYFLIFQIFLEFSSARLVGTKRNDNFYFPYFSSFSDLFWLEMNHNRIYFLFFEFFTIFMEFSITHLVGTEHNGTIIFISLFLIFFQPILAWNEFLMVFFNFLNFFEFSITHRAGTKRNNNFYFLFFSASSNLFWLEMRQ